MKLSLFRRRTASDHARALGQMGLAAQSDAVGCQRAKVRAMCRELCRLRGCPVPAALAEPADG